MGLLAVGLVFVGYTLCYAAVANKGKFATQPWLGVTEDAYDAADETTPTPAPKAKPAKPKGPTIAGKGGKPMPVPKRFGGEGP